MVHSKNAIKKVYNFCLHFRPGVGKLRLMKGKNVAREQKTKTLEPNYCENDFNILFYFRF